MKSLNFADSKSQPLSNLLIRTIAGFFFSVTVIGSALLGEEAVALLFLFFAVVGLHEFYSISKQAQGHRPRLLSGIVLGVVIYALVFCAAHELIPINSIWIIGALSTLILAKELYHLDAQAFVNLGITFFGIIYVILPFSGVNLLATYGGPFSYELPVGFFLILWANDTGAYLIGRWIGKTKLYPSVSPNKTWEGLAGGVLMAMASGYGLSHLFDSSLSVVSWMVIGVIISIFGNIGDLFESHFKRTYGVKDSGHLIPGHGGVLDRFDGLLLSMPMVLCYLYLIRIY